MLAPCGHFLFLTRASGVLKRSQALCSVAPATKRNAGTIGKLPRPWRDARIRLSQYADCCVDLHSPMNIQPRAPIIPMKGKNNMKAKILLLVAFLFSTSAAKAAWVEVSVRAAASVSVDTDTIRRVGDEAKIWTLYNYKAPERLPNGKRILSTKVLEVVNCHGHTSYSATSEDYAEAYGRGDTISSAKFIPFQDERPVVPGTISDEIAKHACGAGKDHQARRDPVDSHGRVALSTSKFSSGTSYRQGVAGELFASLAAFHRLFAISAIL